MSTRSNKKNVGNFSGWIEVADNAISAITDGSFQAAIQLDSVSGDVFIENNQLSVAGTGVGCDFSCNGILVGNMTGNVRLTRNVVRMGSGAPEGYGAAIVYSPKGDSKKNLWVTENIIVFQYANSDGIGMDAAAIGGQTVSGATVEGNLIAGHYNAAIALFGSIANSVVRDNRIPSGGEGVVLTWYTDPTREFQTNNVVTANDLTGGDIYLDTTSLGTRGANLCASVTDLGTDNRVVCQHPKH